MMKDIEYKGKTYSVINPGRIIRLDVNHYKNQIAGGIDNFFTRSVVNRLRNDYGLTKGDYYNIVVLNGESPKCEKCGSDLEFTTLLSGYNETCTECGHLNKGVNPVIEYPANKCRICGKCIDPSINTKVCPECNGKNYSESDHSVIEIDGDMIHYPGKIAKESHDVYLDQFDGATKIKYLKKFLEYIYNRYLLSEIEYYNLIVFGDKEYTPKCENCGGPVEFQNLNLGYKRFCSNKCGYESRGDLSGNFKSYYERLNETVRINKDGKRKKVFTKMSIEEIISLMYHGYKCYSGKYSDKYEKSYLYYAEFKDNPDIFKIGISVDPKDRWCKAGYSSPRILQEGSVEYIAKMEFNIKRKFVKLLVLESEYPTETFLKLNYEEIISFIDNYK